jgi:hypothetical protein
LEVEVQVKVEGYTKSPENKVPIQELCRLMDEGVLSETRKSHSNAPLTIVSMSWQKGVLVVQSHCWALY